MIEERDILVLSGNNIKEVLMRKSEEEDKIKNKKLNMEQSN